MARPSTEVTLPKAWVDQQDVLFFFAHPDRQAHIRSPFGDEMKGEFWSLGEHERNRRKVIIYRVPADNIYYDPKKPQLLKIPMLAFSDETIEDRDDILLPIIHDMMVEKAK